MSNFNDLPERDNNRRIQELSEFAFQAAISESGEFVIQSADNADYGTDYLVEATAEGMMTNIRVHIQLKGTACPKNADGSVSLSVKRTTLNYLLMQPGALFVCFHLPERQLLVRRVDDVIQDYQHRNTNWMNQTTVTVRFSDEFSPHFQSNFKDYMISYAKKARDHRLNVLVGPPEHILSQLEEAEIDLPIPAAPQRASDLLSELYENGKDRTISHLFDKFSVILDPASPKFLPAYMAEINLGLNQHEHDKNRIRSGIDRMLFFLSGNIFSNDSLLYCLGNAWLVLHEHEKAERAYSEALDLMNQSDPSNLAAQCCKNFGTVMENLDRHKEAHELYSCALKLDPNLPEAHFAIALWYYRHGNDLDRTLEHLDSIVWLPSSTGRLASVLGWRLRVFFELGRVEEAFRDIRNLLSYARHLDWVWPWCSKMVATYGALSVDAATLSLEYWNRYLQQSPDDVFAKKARLHCVWLVHFNSESADFSFQQFKNDVEDIVEREQLDAGRLWDRAGHWAQRDENWEDAEKCYRKAFDLCPDEFGYCLGTALNFLGRYVEALPILLDQAEIHQPDAMSWLQVAIAREGTGDLQGSIEAYRTAIQKDENYDLAWFNLGGIYWNLGKQCEALSIWKHAIRRFPMHELALKLKIDFPFLDE